MQLTTTTDYATRIICYLAENEGLISATVLSRQLDIPMNYIFKVTKLLKDAELIRSLDGLKGGYALAKTAEQITLLDIAYATEKTMRIISCLDEEKENCNRLVSSCKIKHFYEELQDILHHKMSISISQLLEEVGGD